MADDDDQLVTKGFLRGEMAQQGAELRSEMRQLGADLRGEMQAMEHRLVDALRGEMHAMERRLVLEIGGIVQRAMGITAEQSRSDFGVLDEKYQDLPARVTTLEHDVAELKRHTT